MNSHTRTWLLLAAGVLAAGVASAAPPPEAAPAPPSALAKRVRRELAALPYYGVFDLLTFKVSDEGTVTLGGEVYNGPLKSEAEKAVERLPGVKAVENKIELLPVSTGDDDLRRAEYRAIYFDPALVRYGTAESEAAAVRPQFYPWGWSYQDWSLFNGPYWTGAPFYGMEPVGEYAIHIIVKHGRVTLVGVVDNDADRNLAGLRAKGVPGTLEVTNGLQVAPAEKAAAAAFPNAG